VSNVLYFDNIFWAADSITDLELNPCLAYNIYISFSSNQNFLNADNNPYTNDTTYAIWEEYYVTCDDCDCAD